MPDGGTLVISCANTEMAVDEIPGLRPGRYVRVEVCDMLFGLGNEGIEPETGMRPSAYRRDCCARVRGSRR